MKAKGLARNSSCLGEILTCKKEAVFGLVENLLESNIHLCFGVGRCGFNLYLAVLEGVFLALCSGIIIGVGFLLEEQKKCSRSNQD